MIEENDRMEAKLYEEATTMKKILVFLLLLGFLCSVSQAKTLEIGPNLGLAFNPNWSTTFFIGATASTQIQGPLWGEAEFFFYLSPFKQWFWIESMNSSAWDLNLSGLYYFKLQKTKITPYAAIGVGIFGWHIDRIVEWFGGQEWSKLKFNFSFGGGVKYPLNEKMSLRFDARYIVIIGTSGDVIRLTFGLLFSLPLKGQG